MRCPNLYYAHVYYPKLYAYYVREKLSAAQYADDPHRRFRKWLQENDYHVMLEQVNEEHILGMLLL